MIGGFNQSLQYAMIVVVEGHEAEWLYNRARAATHGLKYLGYAAHLAGMRLKHDLDEIAFRKGLEPPGNSTE